MNNLNKLLAMRNFLFIIFLFFFTVLAAQNYNEPKSYSVSGYVSSMQETTFDSISKQWAVSNLIHNRLNFKYSPAKIIDFDLELRNRLSFEENEKAMQQTKNTFSTDNGFINLSKNIASGKSYVLNMAVDRMYMALHGTSFTLTLGRQRINWSQTLVWNPNDIFNTYSFFDFDYIERSGSDALRFQYYNSPVSSTEWAIKLNNEKKITTAALYKFNTFEYDFQVLGGLLNSQDYVLGGGWSGAIKHIAFRGELSYFHPKEKFSDTTGVFLASVSCDYTFGNSFMLLAEYLYNSSTPRLNTSFLNFYSVPTTVKNLSIAKHNVVIQANYPITPLLSSSLACMFLPGVNGIYISPSLSYSLSQNFDASFYYQAFNGEIADTHFRINMLYLRLKASF